MDEFLSQLPPQFFLSFFGFFALTFGSMFGLVYLNRRRNEGDLKRRKAAMGAELNSRDDAYLSDDRAERRRMMRQGQGDGNTRRPIPKKKAAREEGEEDPFSVDAIMRAAMSDDARVVQDIPNFDDDDEEIPSVDDLLGLGDDDAGSVGSFADLLEDVQVMDVTTPAAAMPAVLAAPPTRYHQIDEENSVLVQLHTGDETKAQELMSILRDEADGRLMIQIGDTAYRTLVDSPDAKKVFTSVVKELSGVILKADDRPEPQAPPQSADAVEPTTTPPPGSLPGDLPDYRIKVDPDNIERKRFGQIRIKRVEDAPPPVNIAEAIEAYLQYKIERTPQFQKRGIHIRPTPSGGVRIEADGKRFEFVDEVDDADVRAFIQTAINEWQERH